MSNPEKFEPKFQESPLLSVEEKKERREIKNAEITAGYNKEDADKYRRWTLEYVKKHGTLPTTEWLIMVEWMIDSSKENLTEKKILDAGCGFGYEANYLRQRGVEVFGIDLSEHLIKHAKREYPDLEKNFSVGDIKSLPFEDNSFDLIFSKRIIHYLPNEDIEKTYSEFFRCLKRGGDLVFSVHNPLSPVSLQAKKRDQKTVSVELLPGMKVKQPVHDLEDYLSDKSSRFSKYFEFLDIKAGSDDPKSETPEWLLVKARKRLETQ